MDAAATASTRSGNPAQFLTFLIAGEEYGGARHAQRRR